MNYIYNWFHQDNNETLANQKAKEFIEQNRDALKDTFPDYYQYAVHLSKFLKQSNLTEKARQLNLNNKSDFFTHVELGGHKFITCPKPSEALCDTYWNHIYDNDVDTIVSLVNTFEDITETTKIYPSIINKKELAKSTTVSLELLSEVAKPILYFPEYASFMQQEFIIISKVKLTTPKGTKEITIYAIQNWFESDTPHPYIIRKINEILSKKPSKLKLIHCHESLDRTGMLLMTYTFHDSKLTNFKNTLIVVEELLTMQLQGNNAYHLSAIQLSCLFSYFMSDLHINRDSYCLLFQRPDLKDYYELHENIGDFMIAILEQKKVPTKMQPFQKQYLDLMKNSNLYLFMEGLLSFHKMKSNIFFYYLKKLSQYGNHCASVLIFLIYNALEKNTIDDSYYYEHSELLEIKNIRMWQIMLAGLY